MKVIKELAKISGPIIGCPAVFETDEGVVIIGKTLNYAELPAAIRGTTGPGETAILIPSELLKMTK